MAERDPAILLSGQGEALGGDTDKVTLELLGPGVTIHDTALMLFEVLRNRTHAKGESCHLLEDEQAADTDLRTAKRQLDE